MFRGKRMSNKSGKPMRRERRVTVMLCAVLALGAVGFSGYIAGWFANRSRVESDARRYRAMYVPDTAEPAETPVPAPIETPTPSPAPTDTPSPTVEPTAEPDPVMSDMPLPTAALAANPIVVDEPFPTANAGTLVLSLPTPPPVQQSFGELLSLNPDTVGFLSIDDVLALPVAQRLDDNAYYLTHSFDGAEAREGALFLDGMNRLVPEDDCLIVYGHNMKNGTMFGPLAQYGDYDFVRQHPVARFDTIYENREYVPFAAFTASTDPGDDHYFDLRNFIFDETGFELFTLRLQSRSLWRSPVDVKQGDRLLLLVTCEYTQKEGRFLLALRQLRPDETREAMAGLIEAFSWNSEQ